MLWGEGSRILRQGSQVKFQLKILLASFSFTPL